MSVLVVARGQQLIDRILPLINNGVSAEAVSDDDEAVAKLETGDVSALIIGGGVEPDSRERLQSAAASHSVRVIHGAARGKDPEKYVREELLPALRQS